VLSAVSYEQIDYSFDCGLADWLENRKVFMRALTFYDAHNDIPAGFLALTGQQLLKLDLTTSKMISEAALVSLIGSCPRLENVRLPPNSSSATMASLAQHCPRLHTIHLSELSSPRLTDEGLAFLGEGGGALRNVEFRFCRAITDAGLAKLAKGSRKLEIVRLWDCPNITDASVASLTRHCIQLHSLHLDHTQVTGAHIATFGERLRTLSLYNTRVTDAELRTIARACPNLEYMDVGSNLSRITYPGLATLVRRCSKLHTLHLFSTRVTDQGVARIREAYPSLSIVYDDNDSGEEYEFEEEEEDDEEYNDDDDASDEYKDGDEDSEDEGEEEDGDANDEKEVVVDDQNGDDQGDSHKGEDNEDVE
jgi:hypothetical protein